MQEFDALVSLARSDPEAFETLRLAAIERYIAQAPPKRQSHLRSLQWRIEQERNRAKSPLDACVRIVGMMWDKVLADGGLVDNLERLSAILAEQKTATCYAQVLSLQAAHTQNFLEVIEVIKEQDESSSTDVST